MACGPSLFGSGDNYIKVGNGELVAIEGMNIYDRLGLSELRMPYKQLLKSRVILKAGQQNYLLNHLGLGDNATFLVIKVTYDSKSVIEEDNYLEWVYYDDMIRINYISKLMILTGNSTHRIPQLYISNPNTKYNVILDVMVAIIDDDYSFYSDVINQTGRSFVNLEYIDIKTHVVGESIVIYDKGTPSRPLVYITLVNIQSIERTSDILIIYDSGENSIFLEFIDEFNAIQAHSLINYLLENPSVNVNDISPIEDISAPIIYFNDMFYSEDYIILEGGLTSSTPYNTGDGFTFSTSAEIANFAGLITKYDLMEGIIDIITDDRDGVISMTYSQLSILDDMNTNYNSISATGSYYIKFNISDIAQNNLDDITMIMTII